MKKIVALFFILTLSSSVFSQKIYFCESYTDNGDPIGVNSTWTIQAGGGAVYFLFNNNNNYLYSPKMYIYIDKQSGYDYLAYKTLSMNTSTNATWAVYDYTFTEPGYYKVRFLNQDYQTLATEYCTIKMATATASMANSNSYANNEIVDTYYYGNSSIKFCSSVDANYNAVGANTTFNISSSQGGYVYVLIKNNEQAFKSNKLYVDIYKGNNYSEFVETKTYDITPSWASFNFAYTFYQAGQYVFKAYNGNNTLINTAYVNIGYY